MALQEKGAAERKLAQPACHHGYTLPPTPETPTPEVWPLVPACPNTTHTLCEQPPHSLFLGIGTQEPPLGGSQGRDTCGYWVYVQGHLGRRFCHSGYLETSLREQLESQVQWYNELLALQGGGRLRPSNAWSLRPGPSCTGLRDVLVRTSLDKVNYPRKRT